MKQSLILCKREISIYFNSLIGYLVIALFLSITGLLLWFFPDTSLLESGYASIDSFFYLAPYLLLLLVPSVLMRSFAGEKKEGTYVLLQSRPLSIFSIVLGKFCAGVVVVFLTLVPTLVYALSIYLLAYPIGNIDIGAIVGSYIGLFLLACSFVSISLFCSAVTRNPAISCLLAIFLIFLIFYGLGSTSQLFVASDYEEWIASLGMDIHYQAISRGVLVASDFFYFLSIILVFLVLTIGCLAHDFMAIKQKIYLYLGTFCIIFLVNQPFLISFLPRIDFTSDKRFTLQQTSIDIVKSLADDIHITIFLSGDLPNGFKRLKQASLDMAMDLQSYSAGKIKVTILDPREGTAEEQKEFAAVLIDRGLFPTNLTVKNGGGYSQQLIFPFAIVNQGEREVNVSFLQNRAGQPPEQILNNSIQNLEYAFVSAIAKIKNLKPSYIGFTEGHGEASDLELYDAMQSLRVSNQVGRLNLDSISLEDLTKIKILVVAKPQLPFSELEKYKIDYYVRQGGSIIWAIDQLDVSMDHIRESSSHSQPLITRNLNIDDLLFMYGVRLNYELVADLNCSQIPLSIGNIGGQSQIELMPWYFFPILMPNSTNPIVKNLDGIRTEFIGTIDTIQSKGIQHDVLLYSSPYAKVWKTPSMIGLDMLNMPPDLTQFKTKPLPVAILLTGQFPSVFDNRPIPDGVRHEEKLNKVSHASKMIVIADGDWLINQVSAKDGSPYPLGWDRYTESQYANKIFFENMIDYLQHDARLIDLRNREVKLRLLDQTVVKSSRLKWQLINMVFPLGLVLFVALIHQYIRKRRYTRRILHT